MKYNYNKKLLKSLGVGPFLGQVKLREKMIAEAPDTMPQSIYNANILAKKLHPGTQYAVITAVGGEGRQFICGGRNYPPDEEHPAELGWGEVRICPPTAAVYDRFVVEMTFVPAH